MVLQTIHTFKMDPLVAISSNIWPELRNLYIVNWPKGAAACCLLDTQINHPKLNTEFNFKVYCPYGDLNNGMVGLTDKNENVQVIIQPINDLTKIEEALLTTNIIDWNKDIMVPFASPEVVECLKRISNQININVSYENDKAIKYLLKKSSPAIDISFPANTYIASVRSKHIDIVNKTWTYFNEHSKDFFETLIENDLTYMLYSSENDEPLSWVTVNEAGALTHLYCLKPFRRKGYAEFVTKFACNDVLKKGRHVLAYTIEKNYKSQKLLEKIGFQNIGYDYWVSLNKKINNC